VTVWFHSPARLFREKLPKRTSSRSFPFSVRRAPRVIELQQDMATGAGTTTLATPIPILLTVRELHHGGIEHDVTKIAIHLDRSRFEPHVATYHAEGMRFDELTRAGVPILHLPVSSLKSPTALSAAMRMRRYIREHAIRLVHAYDPSAVFTLPIARALRVPVVLSSMLGSRDLLDQRTRRQIRWTDKIVDTVVVNCEAMRRHMTDDEHVSGERIELCYNGVDAPSSTRRRRPNPPRSRTLRSSSDPFACCARKRLSICCRKRSPHPASETRYETDDRGSGPELSRLQANSWRLGLQDDCVFVPATLLVPQFLRALDILSCAPVRKHFPTRCWKRWLAAAARSDPELAALRSW